MNHDLSAERFGVRLRPVRLDDAEFIVRLRNSPRALGNVGDSAADLPGQTAWLQRYFDRANDYYFIVETAADRRPVGTIGVYGIEGATGEWGRWIVVPEVPAGPASAWLALHAGFELLGLDTLLGGVVESNKSVISFHQRIGNPAVGWSPTSRIIGGQPVRLLQYRATRADWPGISEKLSRFARIAEAHLNPS